MAGGLDGGGSMGGGHGQWRASTARAELQHRMEFEKKAGAPLRAGGSEMLRDGQMVRSGHGRRRKHDGRRSQCMMRDSAGVACAIPGRTVCVHR